MPTLKEVQLKIEGVKKTKQITKAMNMVATSRLRGAQQNSDAFRPYAAKFSEVLGSLAEKAGEEASSPLLVPKEAVEQVHIVLCTSDRGLCGGFNLNLISEAEKLLKACQAEGKTVSISCFGKKGRDWAKKADATLENEYLGVVGSRFGFNVAATSGREIVDKFLEDEYDEAYLIYSDFQGMAKQIPTVRQLLPIPPIESDSAEVAEEAADAAYQAEHICEPSVGQLLAELLPKNVYVQIFSGLLETSTSEHAARMMAMDNATKACNDMIDSLTLTYNKARQAAVTSELMDIVGGAEALKG
ncbi:MAG: ATP synthase F1 subunit gamma [Desulfosarcinaceae bacterium]|nr:ATP synthase F1 subunit gamma [Desulfosarcinaceae bacterium]